MTNINKIVIIGGGLAGCEAAYQISKFDRIYKFDINY